MSNEDKLLLKAMQADDEKAFEELFFKYYEALCRFACRYVHTMDIAEEFVQEVYANIWEMRKQLETKMNIRSYLYTSVKNEALDFIKHEEVIQKYEVEIELRFYDEVCKTGEERKTKQGFFEAAQNAIEELPENTRRIYKLSRKDGFTYREIADILAISVKTVESHMSKALRILRERLAPYLPILLIVFLFFDLVA